MGPGDTDGEELLRRVVAERVTVLAFLRSIVRRRDMAEDIFQDLCVLVMQKRQELGATQNLTAWLRTAARGLAMNAIRKQANRTLLLSEAVHDVMEAHWKQLDKAAGSAMGEALEGCIALLSPKARLMVQGHYVKGMTYADLARQTGRPLASLYVSMSRIHKKLGECILRKMALQRGRHG